MIKFYVHLVTECRYFSGGLIELKCAIRGSLGSLGPREIKKKKDTFVSAPSFEDTSVFIGHRYFIFMSERTVFVTFVQGLKYQRQCL